MTRGPGPDRATETDPEGPGHTEEPIARIGTRDRTDPREPPLPLHR
ncbi:hypothetical protein [Streptomyces sp. NPDC002559]